MKRPPDEALEQLAAAPLEQVVVDFEVRQEPAKLLQVLAEECLEARRRGITGTVDPLPANRTPQNCDEGLYAVANGISVNTWTPEQDGKGRCTQVHLVLDLTNVYPGLHAVLRLKSGVGVDYLIRLLHEYRCTVWPDYLGVRVTEGSQL